MAVHFFNEFILLYSDDNKKLNLAVRKSKTNSDSEIPFRKPGEASSHLHRSGRFSTHTGSVGHTAQIASTPIKVGNRDYVPIMNVEVIGPAESVKAFLMFESHDISGCLGFLLQHRLITVKSAFY